MTAPPLVLSLLFVALVGWPALKLAATLLSRPLWRKQRCLRDALLGDGSLEPGEIALVQEAFDEGRGSSLQLILPTVAFFGGIAVAFQEPRGPTQQSIASAERELFLIKNPDASERTKLFLEDPRYRQMTDNAFALAALKYPVCSILTIIAISPSALAISILSRFRASQRLIASAIVSGSRDAVVAFEHALTARAS